MTVHVIATGGTISSHHDGTAWTNVSGAQLIAELGDLRELGADVVVEDVAAGPSSNLSVDDMIGIAERVADRIAEGATGVVVVHGTDTIELTAYLTSLRIGVGPARRPVVFTGSMRVHSHLEPDGPRNLRDALVVAASDEAVGHDVLVCLEGVLHHADRVVKVNAKSVDAFTSGPRDPAGRVAGGRVELESPGAARAAVTSFERDVPLVSCYPGIDGDAVRTALHERRGAVLEVFGDLNVPMQLWEPIHSAWAAGVLVVLASRPFTDTAADPGLAQLGAVGAGGLTAQKARLALMAALGAAPEREGALRFLAATASTYDAGERSTGS